MISQIELLERPKVGRTSFPDTARPDRRSLNHDVGFVVGQLLAAKSLTLCYTAMSHDKRSTWVAMKDRPMSSARYTTVRSLTLRYSVHKDREGIMIHVRNDFTGELIDISPFSRERTLTDLSLRFHLEDVAASYPREVFLSPEEAT